MQSSKIEENLKRLVNNNEIKTMIKKSSTNENPGPDGFPGQFYQTLKEELTPVLKLIQKIEEEEISPNLFYESSITLMPKSDKDITVKKITGQYP